MATSPTDQTVLYEIKFTQIIDLLSQQMERRLPGTFRQGNHRGSKGAQAIKQIGKTRPSLRVNRLEPIQFTDIPHDARWVYPANWDEATPFDSWDALQTEANPKSGYMQDLVAGMNVTMDKECIRAFFETSHTGEQGASTTAFPAGQIVSVSQGASGNTGLTVKKLREAKRLLLAAEVDLSIGELIAVAKATQLDNLYDEAVVTSRDFNGDAPVLTEGKLARFMGIRFIHSEELTSTADPYVQVPVYHTSGMHFGMWQDTQTNITIREDIRGRPWQLYVNAVFGATRLEEVKVVQVNCA